VRRLAFVRRASALGFSLAEVKSLLALRVSARTSCARVRARALAKLDDIGSTCRLYPGGAPSVAAIRDRIAVVSAGARPS
jgi:hypothetical protein